MASVHTFFCIEDNCSALAHVSGGRCDVCFEAYIDRLRQEHNPPRCEWCHECSDLLLSESGRFCGKWCEAGWLNEHNCKSHYDEALEAYTCSTCRTCYPAHHCSGEFDYERGSYVCDDHDDPLCPQYKAAGAVVKTCADCGCDRKVVEPELPCAWFCPPCWQLRFRSTKERDER